MKKALVLLIASLSACARFDVDSASKDEADTGAADPGVDPPPVDEQNPDGSEDTDVPPLDSGEPDDRLEDDAVFHATTLPASLNCGESHAAAISMRNTGSATWTRSEGYKLGTVDDSDPFYTRDTRVWLQEEDVVEPGEAWTFEFEVVAPDTSGVYTTDWQMVREGAHWFGETLSQEITVSCEEPASPETPVGPPDLDEVIWLHTDVSDWPETGELSSVYISSTQLCLDYNKADVWPIYDLRGTDVVANPWIFIWQDGVWYGATWEWMRPGQTCKAMSSVHASHIKRDPFPEDGDWAPTSGQRYWFMLSGLARWSERTVEERTNLVSFVWP